MKPSKLFIASIFFLGLFTTGNMFMADMWSNHDVQSDTSVTVEKEYSNIEQKVRGGNQSIYNTVRTLSTDQGGVLDAASAGLLLVPRTASTLLSPVTANINILSTTAQAFPTFIPAPVVTLLQLLLIAAASFGVLSLALGVKA